MKPILITTAIGITALGIGLSLDNRPEQKGQSFYFDEKVVSKVVPNQDGTMTVYLKNGKTKTYPFSWDKKEEFQTKADTEFVKPNKK